MNRFRPKTSNKNQSKTLLKSQDFGLLRNKPVLVKK